MLNVCGSEHGFLTCWFNVNTILKEESLHKAALHEAFLVCSLWSLGWWLQQPSGLNLNISPEQKKKKFFNLDLYKDDIRISQERMSLKHKMRLWALF